MADYAQQSRKDVLYDCEEERGIYTSELLTVLIRHAIL